MRYKIMTQPKRVVSKLNEHIQSKEEIKMYTIDEIDAVYLKYGTKRDQLCFTVTKMGEYTTNVIFSTETMKYIKSFPLDVNCKGYDSVAVDMNMRTLFDIHLKSEIKQPLNK